MSRGGLVWTAWITIAVSAFWLVLSQPIPTPTLSAPVAHTSPLDRLAEIDPTVSVTYSDDPALNCGGYGGGCYRAETPGTIIISPQAEGEALTYLLLHELAHVHQDRAHMPLDECAADAQAVAWGALPKMTTYLPNCTTEPKE